MTSTEKDFITSVRLGAGLAHEAALSDHPDWDAIYRLAEGHAVLGLLAEGICDEDASAAIRERLWEDSMEIIRRGKQVNDVLAHVVGFLREYGVETILQKGQGVAQCYPNPLLRMSGDIDLLVSEEDFDEAKNLLGLKFSLIEEDNYYKDLHCTFLCDDVEVELHATEFGALSNKTKAQYRHLCQEMFREGNFRSYVCEGVEINLAPATFDAFYIFLHLVKHYYWHGIGLRQILDLSLFLQAHSDEIDYTQIMRWTEQFHLTRQWRAFADIWNQPQLLSLVIRHGNMGSLKSQGFSSHRIVRLLQIVPMNYRFARRHLPFSRWMFLRDFCRSNVRSVMEGLKKYK